MSGNATSTPTRYENLQANFEIERLMKTTWSTNWRRMLWESSLVSIFILGLFYYWYSLADRYAIFLYGHTTVGIPPAQPFDPITISRYWMAGLVATGAVMLLYIAAYWLAARIAAWRKQTFVPAHWWQVWLGCVIPLSIGIPAITMTVNSPTLPPSLAAACVAATLVGLAIALLPGQWAADRPWDLIWLAADGIGLMPALMLLRAIELPSRGLSVSHMTVWLLAMGGLLAGLVWLVMMSGLRIWRHREFPTASALFLAGVGLSYVLLPLIHHLLATPPAFRYISTASNFFAFNPGLRLLAVLTAAVMAIGITAVRRRLKPGRRLAPHYQS